MNSIKNVLLISVLPILIIISFIQQNKDEKINKEFRNQILTQDKIQEITCKIKTYNKMRSQIKLELDCPVKTNSLTLYYEGKDTINIQSDITSDFFQKDNKVIYFEKNRCLLKISGSLEFQSALSKQLDKKQKLINFRDCLKI